MSNLVRQGLLMAMAAAVSLAVVLVLAFVAYANGMVELTGSLLAHGNIVLPWGFLTVLLYIPLALIDDGRRRSKGSTR